MTNKGRKIIRRPGPGQKMAPEAGGKALKKDDFSKLVRDFEVELQMQTENLRRTQEELRAQIEKLKNTQVQLEESRDWYCELYEGIPIAYLTVDFKTNRIVEMNLTACEILKGERRTIKQIRFNRLVEPEFADSLYFAGKKSLEDASQQICELKIRCCDGSSFWALAAVRGNLKTGHVRIALNDITELKKTEQMKDDFIGMVSHELRTPLTVILGAVKVAQEPGLTAKERKELLSDAVHASEDLSLILENLIELSRQKSRRTKLEKTSINIEDFMRHIMSSESRHLNDHRFRLQSSGSLPDIKVDKVKLQQVLFNLLDNAAKYSPENTEIRLTVRKDGDNVLVGVSDKGQGISAEDQAKLFEPFERLSENPNRATGLGLGLVVCRHLIEAHGGKIWVDSTPGRGTTFWFTLPL